MLFFLKKNVNQLNKIESKKQIQQRLLALLKNEDLSDESLESIQYCGSYLQFATDLEKTSKRLLHAQFCHNRMCPICNARKAATLQFELATNLRYLFDKKNLRFAFLTLTVPNVPADQFQATLDRLHQSVYKMLHYKRLRGFGLDKRTGKPFKGVIQGAFRKTEWTYNRQTNTYHIHAHLLLCVHKSYFKSKYYISHAKWLAMWRKAYGDQSITQVHIERIKAKNGQKTPENEIQSAVAEAAKYVGKDADFLHNFYDDQNNIPEQPTNQEQETFHTVYTGLYKRRMTAFIGCLKDADKLYKAGKLDGYKDPDNTLYSLLLIGQYDHYAQKYKSTYRRLPDNEIKRLRELGLQTIKTAAELRLEAINNHLIDYTGQNNDQESIALRIVYSRRKQQLQKAYQTIKTEQLANWQVQTILMQFKDVLFKTPEKYCQHHQKDQLPEADLIKAQIYLDAFTNYAPAPPSES